jgi:hypothetical protein
MSNLRELTQLIRAESPCLGHRTQERRGILVATDGDFNLQREQDVRVHARRTLEDDSQPLAQSADFSHRISCPAGVVRQLRHRGVHRSEAAPAAGEDRPAA